MDIIMAAALCAELKKECERQHGRAEAAERLVEQNSLSFHAIQTAHLDQIAELSAKLSRYEALEKACRATCCGEISIWLGLSPIRDALATLDAGEV